MNILLFELQILLSHGVPHLNGKESNHVGCILIFHSLLNHITSQVEKGLQVLVHVPVVDPANIDHSLPSLLGNSTLLLG